MNHTQLPIDFKDSRGREVFENLVKNLPKDIEVYLVAGTVRNAIHRYFHGGDSLEQRDYDQIVVKGSDKYLEYLREIGFYEGRIQRPTQKVMIKSFVGSEDPEDFANNLVFDINLVDSTSATDNLEKHVGLTVNGNAISIRDIFSENWQEKLVSLPNALEAIRDKKLILNPAGYQYQAANLFSVIRFVYNGYTPPPKDDIELLIKELPRVEDERYEKNIQKVFKYVGGEEAARTIWKEIGVDVDVFDKRKVIEWLV
jgi:hypothetical protein